MQNLAAAQLLQFVVVPAHRTVQSAVYELYLHAAINQCTYPKLQLTIESRNLLQNH